MKATQGVLPAVVVGGGPAGLECARALGQRGYRVALAEAGHRVDALAMHQRPPPRALA